MEIRRWALRTTALGVTAVLAVLAVDEVVGTAPDRPAPVVDTAAFDPSQVLPVVATLPEPTPAPPEPPAVTPAPVPLPPPEAPPLPPPPPPPEPALPAPEPPQAPAPSTGPIEPPLDQDEPEPEIVLGSIDIPRIGLSAPLNQGISLHTIDRGPSHWPGSALPGEVGNVVVAGHRVTHTHPFRDIDQLVAGDEISFTVGGVRSVYAVNGQEVVSPDAMRIVDPTPTPTATLFACHPPGSARYRFVVTADLVRTEG